MWPPLALPQGKGAAVGSGSVAGKCSQHKPRWATAPPVPKFAEGDSKPSALKHDNLKQCSECPGLRPFRYHFSTRARSLGVIELP
eukprot:689846-Alexandrium_andersonii.AAC.1